MKPVSFKILGISILVISFIIGWKLFGYHDFLHSPLRTGKDGITLEVPSGITVKNLSRELARLGLLENPEYFSWRARWRGISHQIKAGEYFITTGTFPDQFLDMLIHGKVKLHSLTIVEGWTFRQLLQAVQKNAVLKRTLENVPDKEIMSAIGHANEHPEGKFLPETYHFPRGTTDREFLKRAYRAMDKTLSSEWKERDKSLPLKSPYEALVLASIIEKETAVKNEYTKISGVFTRRLQKGMRLQTDPTVIYGLGESFDGNLRLKDLRKDTPYNTYTRTGLPPTPIALPGREALRAALHPDNDTTLYFVAKGNGEHYFSSTLHEHNQAVIRYQLGGKKKPFSSYPGSKKH